MRQSRMLNKIIEFVILTLVVLICSALARATTVTGTLVDPTGQTLVSARVHIEFTPASGTFGSPTVTPVDIVTDNSGSFSTTLTGNDTITPSRSSYTFTICPNATVSCFVVRKVSIIGTTQDVSATLNAGITTITVSAQTLVPKAYNDTEVPVTDLTNTGAIYWNTLDRILRLWDGTGWNGLLSTTNNGDFIDAGFLGCHDDGGTTNNGSCIQQAVNLSVTTGAPVIFPKRLGNCFYFSTQLQLLPSSNIINPGDINPASSGCFVWNGSAATSPITRSGVSTTINSRYHIEGIRLTTTNTNMTANGFDFPGITNGNYFTRNYAAGFFRNYYAGGPTGSGSDVTRYRDNWCVNPVETCFFMERMTNVNEISNNMIDMTIPSTGTAAIRLGTTSSSPSDAVYIVSGNKLETNNGAHLADLNGQYGFVVYVGNIMRGNPTFNGLGGDNLYIENSDGNNIAAIGLAGTPVCRNLINIVQRGFTIPCTSTGPRRAFWTGGSDGYGINGWFLHGANFATDPSNVAAFMDGSLMAGVNAKTDMSTAIATSPLQRGNIAALPATCTLGQLFFANDAASTNVIYACTATNTWTLQTGTSTATGGVFIQSINTNYTTVAADKGKLIRMTPNANNVTFTLPATPPSATWWVVVQSVNTLGFTTSINSSGTNLDGSPTSTTPVTIGQAQNIMLWTNGTSYYSVRWSTPYTVTTASLGGAALVAGACSSLSTTLQGTTVGARAIATASDGTDQDNYIIKAFVPTAGTVSVKVCAITAGTPTAKTYNVTVWP